MIFHEIPEEQSKNKKKQKKFKLQVYINQSINNTSERRNGLTIKLHLVSSLSYDLSRLSEILIGWGWA